MSHTRSHSNGSGDRGCARHRCSSYQNASVKRGQECARHVRYILTGAGLVRLIGVAAVVAIAAHADGGGLSCGAAVRRALQTQTRTLG